MDSIKQTMGTTPNHTEEEQRKLYDNLPAEQRDKQSFTEWVKEAYNEQYEKWMPWLEDQYLKWFGKGDNKASYVTKGALESLLLSALHAYADYCDQTTSLRPRSPALSKSIRSKTT